MTSRTKPTTVPNSLFFFVWVINRFPARGVPSGKPPCTSLQLAIRLQSQHHKAKHMVSNFDPVRVALEEVFTERVQHSMESRIIFVPLLWHHSPQKMVCITVSNQIDLRMIASSSPKLSSRSSALDQLNTMNSVLLNPLPPSACM